MKKFKNDAGIWRKENKKRPWYEFALKLLLSKKDEIVLDIGAGAGEFAQILKKSGKLVHCCDFSRIYIEELKKKGFPSKIVDFNSQLPYKSNTFDGAVCLEVIEHIIKAEAFLKEINRILKKDGWLILSTPNISWFGYRGLSLIGKVPFKEGYHLRYFNYYHLKKKLADSGFKIKKEACFTPIPYINRIKQFWLPIKFWQNLLAQDLVFLCRKK